MNMVERINILDKTYDQETYVKRGVTDSQPAAAWPREPLLTRPWSAPWKLRGDGAKMMHEIDMNHVWGYIDGKC